jgi:hypothetical protein
MRVSHSAVQTAVLHSFPEFRGQVNYEVTSVNRAAVQPTICDDQFCVMSITGTSAELASVASVHYQTPDVATWRRTKASWGVPACGTIDEKRWKMHATLSCI